MCLLSVAEHHVSTMNSRLFAIYSDKVSTEPEPAIELFNACVSVTAASPVDPSFSMDRLSTSAGTSRSSSLESDLLASGCSVLDTALLDTEADLLSTKTDDWRKSAKLVQKGLAFSKVFKTLRDTSEDNTINPSRLTNIKRAGVGSFATVDICWLASDSAEVSPTRVAVKRLKYEALRHRSDLERFFKEAELMRKLNHRSIAAYVGVGNFRSDAIESLSTTLTPSEARKILKSTYIVQEFVGGGSLKDVLLQSMMTGKKVYTDSQACHWATQIAEGLHYLHSSLPRVMHRDLKLDNILMRENGDGSKEAVLVDFGLSVFLPGEQKKSQRRTSSSFRSRRSDGSSHGDMSRPSVQIGTHDWQILADSIDQNLVRADYDSAMARYSSKGEGGASQSFDLTGKAGTFMYMAPEVYSARQYNEKADVFSFGCVLYEMFSRVIVSTHVVGPTGNPQATKVYARKVADGYRRPLPAKMPLQLQQLITDCWAQEAAERPDMDEILERLYTLKESGVFAAVEGEANRPACSSCIGCSIM